MNLEKIKKNAKELSVKARIKLFLYSILFFAYMYIIIKVLSLIMPNLGLSLKTALNITIILIIFFTTLIISGIGISLYKVYKNEKTNLFSPFINASNYFTKIYGTIFFTIIFMILPILANIIVPRIAASVFPLDYITLMLVITNGTLFKALKYLEATQIIMLLIFILLYAWLIMQSYYYRLTLYLYTDNKNNSSLNVVQTSKRMMEGKRLDLFLLDLYFIFIGFVHMLIAVICTNFLLKTFANSQLVNIIQIGYLIFITWYIIMYWLPYEFYNEISDNKSDKKEIISSDEEIISNQETNNITNKQNNEIKQNAQQTISSQENVQSNNNIISDDFFTNANQTVQNAQQTISNQENVQSNNGIISDDFFTNANQIEQNIQKTISNQENVQSNNDIISDDFFANK